MLGLSKEEREIHDYQHKVLTAFGGLLHFLGVVSSGQFRSGTWNKWLEFKPRGSYDLRELLTQKVSDEHKARAVAILLSPKIVFVPFAWDDDSSVENYLHEWENISVLGMSPALQTFMVEVLDVSITAVLDLHTDHELQGMLYHYNKIILKMLAVLHEDDPQAVQLFERFMINDPICYQDRDGASGYVPFFHVLHADVPEKWKWLADEKMREVIRSELSERSHPRMEWEEALENYLKRIHACVRSKDVRKGAFYSTELLASQLEFILGLPTNDRPLFNSSNALPFLSTLRGEDYKELRYDITRHVVNIEYEKKGAFEVHDENSCTLAKVMLEEFGEIEPDLGDILRDSLEKWGETCNEREANARLRKAREDAILAEMR